MSNYGSTAKVCEVGALGYRCEVTESVMILDSGVYAKLYGLYLYNRDPLLAKQRGEYSRVDGISPDYDEVLRLRDLIEELDVYPVHLAEIVEDYLS